MNKLIVVGVFLFCLIGSYFMFSNIYIKKPEIDLDGNFDRVINELNDYDGAMIVSYDTETGEIIGKRKVGEQKEAGVLSITEEAWEQSNNYPKGTKIVLKESSPSDVINYIGGKN